LNQNTVFNLNENVQLANTNSMRKLKNII